MWRLLEHGKEVCPPYKASSRAAGSLLIPSHRVAAGEEAIGLILMIVIDSDDDSGDMKLPCILDWWLRTHLPHAHTPFTVPFALARTFALLAHTLHCHHLPPCTPLPLWEERLGETLMMMGDDGSEGEFHACLPI